MYFSSGLYYFNGIKSKSVTEREDWGERVEDWRRKEMAFNSLHTWK